MAGENDPAVAATVVPEMLHRHKSELLSMYTDEDDAVEALIAIMTAIMSTAFSTTMTPILCMANGRLTATNEDSKTVYRAKLHVDKEYT